MSRDSTFDTMVFVCMSVFTLVFLLVLLTVGTVNIDPGYGQQHGEVTNIHGDIVTISDAGGDKYTYNQNGHELEPGETVTIKYEERRFRILHPKIVEVTDR